jgi:hypothetical protein
MELLNIGFYVLGCCIASGITGAVRDEMEGILDLFCIFFWPIIFILWFTYKIMAFAHRVGVELSSKLR